MSDLLIRRAEVRAGVEMDVRVSRGRILAIESSLPAKADDQTIDAAGGALLPGLHDHHIHLFALAAANLSAKCGPSQVRDREELSRVLTTAPRHKGWIRGVGYHESVAGDLDCQALDALAPDEVPIRIQHRSGALWILNTAAIHVLGLSRGPLPKGVERNASGGITGRVFHEDGWLRERIGAASIPDLSGVGRELASCGVTAVMDASANNGTVEFSALSDAVASGELRQHVVAMGKLDELPLSGAQIEIGPHKIMLRETSLPDFDELVETIRRAHDAERCVAFHCVTRSELVMAVTALHEAGSRPGDRIEHASVAPPELVVLLSELRLWVVTQPGFIYERGDAYVLDVASADKPWLYRGRGFLEAGVDLGAGTDAPYGDADPWLAIRTAVNRRTRDGQPLGLSEALSPERALALFTSPIEAPGAAPALPSVGDLADFCLVDVPWTLFRDQLNREHVMLTLCRGKISWRRESDAKS